MHSTKLLFDELVIRQKLSTKCRSRRNVVRRSVAHRHGIYKIQVMFNSLHQHTNKHSLSTPPQENNNFVVNVGFKVTAVNPIYNDIRYNSIIRYNVNSGCTKISGSCIFSLTVPCYSLGKYTSWIFVRIASLRRF